MEDSSLLIENICQAFVEIVTTPKPKESFGSLYGSLYFIDINREKTLKSLSPFNNAQVCYNSLGYIPPNPEVHYTRKYHCLFYLNGFDINLLGEITEEPLERLMAHEEYGEGESLVPCSVVIHQGLQAPLEYFLTLCSLIRQPIKDLFIYGQITRPMVIPLQVQDSVELDLQQILQRYKCVSAEEFEPVLPMDNLSESVVPSLSRELHPLMNAVNSTHLTVAVFYQVDCQCLAKSLNECEQLIHLAYIKCRNVSFKTLGKNMGLMKIIVKDCTLGPNEEAELCAQLKYLTKLERISFSKIRCEKYLGKLAEKGVFPSWSSMKRLTLENCNLTTPTAVTLMKSLIQCPLSEFDLSNNYLRGCICELFKTSDVIFTHLIKIKWDNCNLQDKDAIALARLIDKKRLPVIQAVSMKGNDLPSAASDELQKSCEYFRRRKGLRVQVYTNRKT